MTNKQTSNPTPHPTVLTAYGPKPVNSLVFPPDGKTKQSMKDECDINTIMARYLETGQMEYINQISPQYGDVTGVSFETSMETITTANEMFAGLPAKTRRHFDNSPENFFEFVNDPENAPEAREMGLLPALDPSPPPTTTPEPLKPADKPE